MLTIRRVTVTYGRTLNTGNFSNLRLECTIEADIYRGGSNDPEGDALRAAWASAHNEVQAQWERFEKARAEKGGGA